MLKKITIFDFIVPLPPRATTITTKVLLHTLYSPLDYDQMLKLIIIIFMIE